MTNDTFLLLREYDRLLYQRVTDPLLLVLVYLLPFIVFFSLLVIFKWNFSRRELFLALYLLFLFSIFCCLCFYQISVLKTKHDREINIQNYYNNFINKNEVLSNLENDELMKSENELKYLEVREIIKKKK